MYVILYQQMEVIAGYPGHTAPQLAIYLFSYSMYEPFKCL